MTLGYLGLLHRVYMLYNYEKYLCIQ